MDSFINNPNVVDWPTKEGWYWFWGYRYSRKGLIKENEKEIILCQARRTQNSLLVVAEGQFFFESEGEERQFIPATLPEVV